MLENIFGIYLPVLVTIVTLTFNILLVFKKITIFNLIMFNLILALIWGLLGVNPFDLIGQFIDMIVNLIISTFDTLIGKIF